MARLIIVSGASGAGKTFLLDKLHSLNEKIRILKKLTTRPLRKNEVSNETKDLLLNRSIEEVRSLDYTYHYCGHFYGFNKSDIDNAILQGFSPIVIVASCSTIHKIKKDYKNALVLYVQNILSGADLKEQLVKERDPIEVDERMARQERSFRDYINHIDKKCLIMY
jgi:guanylate kinase